jgi:hypothetical protein
LELSLRKLKISYLLLLVSILNFTAIAHGASRCENALLNTVHSTKTHETLAQYLDRIEGSHNPRLYSFRETMEVILKHDDPYSMFFDLKQVCAKKGTNIDQELIQVLDLLILGDLANEKRFSKINEWVTSGIHARTLYYLLRLVGSDQLVLPTSELLVYLKSNNKYFNKVYLTKSKASKHQSLVTFSFEKESPSPQISLLYRPKNIPEDKWIEESEDTRLRLLRRAFKAHELVPTQLRPDYISDYSEEFETGGYGWEIKHKGFEVNREETEKQLEEITSMFKETHSIHLHLSFELPNDYQNLKEFRYWFKQVNDYIYLKGMEEGLHESVFTKMLILEEDASPKFHEI